MTLSLTSRQGCVFSESAIANLLGPAASSENATFYSVSGCPDKLFAHMVRLGSFAREFKLAATMTCVSFNMAPVLAVEHNIREWSDSRYDMFNASYTPTSLVDGQDEGDMLHFQEDLHHCAEAWRCALLLYIEKVFKWQTNQSNSSVIQLLARRTLNHVSSCRRTSMIQKQLLLPVFLAGCETDREDLREQALTYCHWWSEKTRYDMFLTAGTLLADVWANDDPLSWWGSVMDEKGRLDEEAPQKQYLFG